MVEAPEADSRLEELLDRLLGSGGPSAARVRSAGERQVVPLSVGQRQVLLQAASISEPGLWSESICVPWRGPLNAAALERSLNEVCRRHDVLRTRLCIVDGETYQVVNPPEWRQLPTIDLRHLPRETADDHARSFANAQVQRPFDHAIEAPWRATLVTVADDDRRLYMVVHRVLMDDESVVLLIRELRSIYEEFADGATETTLPPPIHQFTDHVLWTGTAANDRDDSGSEAYWQELLGEPLPVLQLAVDRSPSVPTFACRAYSFDLPFDSIRRLQDLCTDEGTTMYGGALAAFIGVLHRWTARTDIMVGTQNSARDRGGLSDVLGNFLTTTLVRIQFHEQLSFRQLLRIVQQNTCNARKHRELPHQEFARAFLPQHNAEDDAPVRVMFSMQADRLSREVHSDYTRWDLHLDFAGCAEPPQARLVYRCELFDSVTVARFAAELCSFLEASTLDADKRISDLPLIWADTRIPGESVPDLVARVAEQTPQARAVIFRDQVLTFGELNTRANQLARHLQARGVRADQLVGLYVTRSIELVVGIVGILKSGGAYVPLDPSYPAARLGVILGDSKPRVVLTQAELLEQLPASARDIAFCLDADWPSVAAQSAARIDSAPCPHDLAYVLYTSGSTGTPKGVMIEHAGLTNYLAWAVEAYDVASGSGSVVQSSIAFDLTVTSLLAPLVAGRPVRLIPDDQGPEGLAEVLRSASNLSLVKLTPAHLDVLSHQMSEDDVSGRTRAFVIGGEALDAAQLALWRTRAPETRLINEYGPTETVVGCCVYEVKPEDPQTGPVLIGRPIANTQLYVLDEYGTPVTPGKTGELYIGGVGVARGYLNRPELTASRFLPNPFVPGTRMYRSGDLVRSGTDGNLEFLGRIDDQMKIRGYRIEPAEIESALLSHPSIRQAAVTVQGSESADKRLLAYFVPRGEVEIAQLREHVRSFVPQYMLPAEWIALDALPLTVNGKLDRAQLPKHTVQRNSTESGRVPLIATEAQLVELWETLLNVSPIGVHDNFFDLGGHSLLALRLFTAIEQMTGRKLPLITLLEAPTVRSLAETLQHYTEDAPGSVLVPIQPNGDRRPFFCVHGFGGGIIDYSALARGLAPDQPFYAIRARELTGDYSPSESVEEMARYYVEAIRKFQPFGPYLIGGYSAGGAVAFEMAQQLVRTGQEIGFLGVFDTVAPLPPSLAWRQGLRDISYLLQNVPGWLGDFAELEPTIMRARVRRRLRSMATALLARIPRTRNLVRLNLQDVLDDLSEIPEERRRFMEVHLRALHLYVPRPYPGKITLFRAAIQPLLGWHDPQLGWKDLAAEVDVFHVPGSHHSVLQHPWVDALAQALQSGLDRTTYLDL